MFSQLKIKKFMKKDTWKTIIQVVVSILTAALTALGTTRYLENNYSGGGEYTHSGIDCTGHHKLYGSNSLKVIGAG